jgi:hypothetical protein
VETVIDLVKVGLNPEQASDLTLKRRLKLKRRRRRERGLETGVITFYVEVTHVCMPKSSVR